MKHIVSLSGGIGSYHALKRVLDQNNKEDVLCVFCDTLEENGDLYRFLEDIKELFDIEIEELCVGKSPWELAFEDNFLYNSRVANCSLKLKSRPFKRWLREHFEPGECIVYLGIDWTEKHRCDAITKNYAPYEVRFPLCDKPYLYKNELIDQLKQNNIEIPLLYKLGFSHNNCNGFCFKAGIGHFKNLYEKYRMRYLECENKERMLIKQIGREVSILKRKGKPYTLRNLRKDIENNVQLSIFDDDIGGCACFGEE